MSLLERSKNMINNILKKLSPKKKDNNKETPKKYNIDIQKQDNIYRIIINDYISFEEFANLIKSNEKFKILNMPWAIICNSTTQGINIGTYYIINMNNHIYYLLLSEKKIIILERTIEKMDEIEEELYHKKVFGWPESQTKLIKHDREISIYPNNSYGYRSVKHVTDGGSYDMKFYSSDDNNPLHISTKEAYDNINSIITNLENIPNINTILNIDNIKNIVLEDLKNKISNTLK